MQVKASIPSHGFDYHIHGDLIERLERDESTGAIVGQIPILRLLVQGDNEIDARKLLGEMFIEFCEVELERGDFWETLYKRGFVVFDPTQHGRQGASQYLEIAKVVVKQGGDGQSTYFAETSGGQLAGV